MTTPIPFNITIIRRHFPNLKIKIHGKPLVYLDNAATTFKPQTVIDTIVEHYQTRTSNVHRGVHFLSEKATADFEKSREKVRNFLNARNTSEIIFTKGRSLVNDAGAAFRRDVVVFEDDESTVCFEVLKVVKQRFIALADQFVCA